MVVVIVVVVVVVVVVIVVVVAAAVVVVMLASSCFIYMYFTCQNLTVISSFLTNVGFSNPTLGQSDCRFLNHWLILACPA
ncbi:hypothetical protein ElyMa_001598700 [Elysia marginata]|uniref:Uncharacterized protein n=1 Tax=Elysia marginata TaxID=1093978 RepID=A0AAV4JJI7_9GAST|nr:hypothetical protein ElyMa_001598700 [Elysia marginata]